jgi:oligopeptide transport system substrate-binding protein
MTLFFKGNMWRRPLTLTLAPSDGAREFLLPSSKISKSRRRHGVASIFSLSPSDGAREFLLPSSKISKSRGRHGVASIFSLAPSDGERVGVRGNSNCMLATNARGCVMKSKLPCADGDLQNEIPRYGRLQICATGRVIFRRCLRVATLLIAMILTALHILGAEPIEGGAKPPSPAPGGTLRLALPTDVRSLDPAIAYEAESWPFVRLVYHGLIDYDEGLNLVPWQAKDWSISEDGRIYTFHLLSGIRFSNGREVQADDYCFTLERVLNPKTKSPGDGFYRGILGAKEYQEGKAPHVRGLQAPRPDTLVIELEKPDLSFRYMMAMPFAFVVPREAVELHGDDFPQHPVGTGPYLLQEWRRGARLRFVRNPVYSGRENSYLNVIEAMIGGDETLHLMMFERGELDIACITPAGVPIPDFTRIMRTPRLRDGLERMPHSGTWYISLNTEIPPFDNVKVRRAMNFATNKQRLIRLLNNRGIPARGVLPPPMPGFNPQLKGYDYDPAKARQLLAEAGYASGFSTAIWFENDLTSSRLAAAIKQDWSEAGVSVDLKPAALALYLEAVKRRKNAPCALGPWLQDYPDPSNFLDVLFHGGRIVDVNCNNRAFYNNSKVNELLDRAASCGNVQQRLELYQEAEAIIVDEAPWVFLFHPFLLRLTQPWLRGPKLHPIWPSRFERMWLEK